MNKKDNTYDFIWGVAHKDEPATFETVNDFEVYYSKEKNQFVGEFDRTYEFNSDNEIIEFLFRIKRELIKKLQEMNDEFDYSFFGQMWYKNLGCEVLVGDSLYEVIEQAVATLFPVIKMKDEREYISMKGSRSEAELNSDIEMLKSLLNSSEAIRVID